MSSTVTATSEWVHYYEQTVDEQATSSFSLSDATTVAATSDGNTLTPTSNLSKPIRRRSRTSKKTPTTILNTSPSNFRALVQQFTGCPGRRTGPINLNFTLGNRRSDRQDATASNIPRNNNGNGYGYDQEQYRDVALANPRADYAEIHGDFAMEDTSNLEEPVPGEIPSSAAYGYHNQNIFM